MKTSIFIAEAISWAVNWAIATPTEHSRDQVPQSVWTRHCAPLIKGTLPVSLGFWSLDKNLYECISSFASPLTQAVAQLCQVTAVLVQRPVSLWDAEYGCARFAQLTAEL